MNESMQDAREKLYAHYGTHDNFSAGEAAAVLGITTAQAAGLLRRMQGAGLAEYEPGRERFYGATSGNPKGWKKSRPTWWLK